MILKDSSYEWLWRCWESGALSKDMEDEPVSWLAQYIFFNKIFQSYIVLKQTTEPVSKMCVCFFFFPVNCSSKLIELKEEIIGT